MGLRKIKKVSLLIAYVLAVYIVFPNNAYAMHIMEGFLPFNWAALWWIVMIPFVIAGVSSIKKTVTLHPSLKMLLGMAGAFAFVLSALKIPSVTGSCSHPTIRRAQVSRSGYVSMKSSYRSLSRLFSALLGKVFVKSQELYNSMAARCYMGEIKVLTKKRPVNLRNYILIAGFELPLILLNLLGRR